MSGVSDVRLRLAATWRQRPERERRGIVVALALFGSALVWTLLLAPAWRLWQQAPAREAAALAQLERVQTLAAEYQGLAQRPASTREATQAQLRDAVARHLGAQARVEDGDDRLVVQLVEVPADALAALLAQARQTAHVLPVAASLRRTAAADARWSGTLAFALPER